MKKIQNSKFKIQNFNQAGFTLIELILYIVLVTIMLSTLIPFAWNVIEGGVKVTVEQEVYSQARYLSERIKKEIRDASTATCTSATVLTLTNSVAAKSPTTITLASNAVSITQGTQIPSSVRLHSNDTLVSASGNFCTTYTGTNTDNVQISFTIADNYSGTTRQEYNESLNVQFSAETRN